jgi:hypothetical protein
MPTSICTPEVPFLGWIASAERIPDAICRSGSHMADVIKLIIASIEGKYEGVPLRKRALSIQNLRVIDKGG